MNFEITELSDFSGEMAHIYSVTLRGEEQTLLEQFFDDNAEYEAELATIVEKLMVMGNDTGCRYEFFKHHEGALADGVAALRAGQIRLYCLYFDRTAVFFGSGGYKSRDKGISGRSRTKRKNHTNAGNRSSYQQGHN